MLFLLACTCGEAPSPEPEPEPTVALAYPSLDLTPRARRAIDAHIALMGVADASDEALCAAVRSATTTPGILAERIYDAGADSGRAEVFDETQALDDALPGIHLGWTSEGLYAGPDWADLAQAAGPGTPSGRFLLAVEGLHGSFGHSGWIDWTWDQGGCSNPVRSAELLVALEEAWASAPACLREPRVQELTAELERFGTHACYCTGPETAREQVREVVGPLWNLPQLGGPEVAQRLVEDLPAARYGDSECAGH